MCIETADSKGSITIDDDRDIEEKLAKKMQKEMVDQPTLSHCLEEYCGAIGVDVYPSFCACCGEKTFPEKELMTNNEKAQDVDISHLGVLKMDPVQRDRFETLSERLSEDQKRYGP